MNCESAKHNQPAGTIVALTIAGDTPDEIALELSNIPNEQLSKLIVIYECEIGDLVKKICQAKGIKFKE